MNLRKQQEEASSPGGGGCLETLYSLGKRRQASWPVFSFWPSFLPWAWTGHMLSRQLAGPPTRRTHTSSLLLSPS
jgi:hypothetical protein